jgi:hypothetical protein
MYRGNLSISENMEAAISTISATELQKFFESLRREEQQTIRGITLAEGMERQLTNHWSRVKIIDELESLFNEIRTCTK